eukprot:9233466-Alexandrium_andersonii.AAC.1
MAESPAPESASTTRARPRRRCGKVPTSTAGASPQVVPMTGGRQPATDHCAASGRACAASDDDRCDRAEGEGDRAIATDVAAARRPRVPERGTS